MVLREVAFARQGKLGIEFTADEDGGPPAVRAILPKGLASALPPDAVPPGSVLHSVNGEELANATHSYAVSTLRQATSLPRSKKQPLVLVFQPPPEAPDPPAAPPTPKQPKKQQQPKQQPAAVASPEAAVTSAPPEVARAPPAPAPAPAAASSPVIVPVVRQQEPKQPKQQPKQQPMPALADLPPSPQQPTERPAAQRDETRSRTPTRRTRPRRDLSTATTASASKNRRQSPANRAAATPESSMPTAPFDVRFIEPGPLGIEFEQPENDDADEDDAENVAPLTIRSIFSDGLAAKKAPPLMPGCVLLGVNADELLGLAAADALQALREATQQKRSRAKPLVLRFGPPQSMLRAAPTENKLAKVAQEADLNRRKRDEWLKEAQQQREAEEAEYRKRNSVHRQARTPSNQIAEVSGRLAVEGVERENRIAALRAEVVKGEEDTCQPTPTILEHSRKLATSHADFLTRIADWTAEKQRREEEYEEFRVIQAEAVPLTIHEMVQVDVGDFWQRQQEKQDEAAQKLEVRKAEEVRRSVAEVKATPAIDKRSAQLAAESRGDDQASASTSKHAEHLLAWGKQASERKTRKRQELEAKQQPPPSPAINANSKRLAAKWEKTQAVRRQRKKLLTEEQANAESTFKPAINARSKEWRASSVPSGGRHSRYVVDFV